MRSRFAVVAMLAALAVPSLVLAQGPDMVAGRGSGPNSHDMRHPLGKKQWGLRQEGLKAKARGLASGRVRQVAKGQFVELEQTRADRIFVVIAEFGDAISSLGGLPGPRHNQIAQPDRTQDNVTIWQSDYNRQHFDNMYFTKMADYYKSQSSGRYGFSGTVVDWVRVPFNEARYGTNACGSIVCSTVWALVRDAINIWTANQLAAGRTAAQVKAELDTFDIWDRYDHDGDGNFDEADGYIDHFQIVHAGEGEETGGGAQGANAIWSHRWYAYFTGIGSSEGEFANTTFSSNVADLVAAADHLRKVRQAQRFCRSRLLSPCPRVKRIGTC